MNVPEPPTLLQDEGTAAMRGATSYGMKTAGVMLIPQNWRLPFAVVPTPVFEQWLTLDPGERLHLIERVAAAIVEHARAWLLPWPAGIILRSSTTTETLHDRGSHHSPQLPRDYDLGSVTDALDGMYQGHKDLTGSQLAVLIQPLLGQGKFGHLSNERRVSKTINQWEWEQERPSLDKNRVNSQRHRSPSEAITVSAVGKKGFLESIKSVGAWAAALGRGRAHLEWAWTNNTLFLLQLDFEDDSPDLGENPLDWHRASDHSPTSDPPPGSAFERVTYGDVSSRWKKVENTRLFAAVRESPYPALFTITGNRALEALAAGADLAAQLDVIAGGRVVCRTDTTNQHLPRTNLPRTHTVTSTGAVEAMQCFTRDLG